MSPVEDIHDLPDEPERPFEPAPPQLPAEASINGKSVYIDGEMTMADAHKAFGSVGFMLYNDGTGRVVARQILPSLLKPANA